MEIQKGTEIQEIKDIAGTPFKMVTNENGSLITMGNYRLTEEYGNEKELVKLTKGVNWNFLVNVITTVMAVRDEAIRIQELTNKN